MSDEFAESDHDQTSDSGLSEASQSSSTVTRVCINLYTLLDSGKQDPDECMQVFAQLHNLGYVVTVVLISDNEHDDISEEYKLMYHDTAFYQCSQLGEFFLGFKHFQCGWGKNGVVQWLKQEGYTYYITDDPDSLEECPSYDIMAISLKDELDGIATTFVPNPDSIKTPVVEALTYIIKTDFEDLSLDSRARRKGVQICHSNGARANPTDKFWTHHQQQNFVCADKQNKRKRRRRWWKHVRQANTDDHRTGA